MIEFGYGLGDEDEDEDDFYGYRALTRQAIDDETNTWIFMVCLVLFYVISLS